MAVKAVKTTIEPPIAPPVDELNFDFESMIADEILDNLDWSKVKTAMLTKVKQRFFAWLTTGDRPVNISQFPELAVLPSADEQEKAA